MPSVIYRWYDVLGNENVVFADDYEHHTHIQIIDNIMSYRERFQMNTSQLQLVITINDSKWVSYTLLKPGDSVMTWRIHKN